MKTERNYGADLYRILAMVMITVLHINNQHLHFLDENQPEDIQFKGYLIEYICYCGVNCFAILSGFLHRPKPMDYDEKWFRKIFDFWGKCVLFGLIIYFSATFVIPTINIEIKNIVFILCLINLWYVGAYFGLLLFLPLLSNIFSRISLRGQTFFFFITFSVFTLANVFKLSPETTSASLDRGYSILWLIVCFCWGQVLQNLAPYIFRLKYIVLFSITGVLIGAILPFLIYWYADPSLYTDSFLKNFDVDKFFLMNYTSPFCVLEAVSLLFLFLKFKITNKVIQKVLAFISTYSFGIYLLQCDPVVWKNFIKSKDYIPESQSLIWWYFAAAVLGLFIAGIVLYFLISKIYDLCFPWAHKVCYTVIMYIFSFIKKVTDKFLLKSEISLPEDKGKG
ncbi:MAG: acyltransferase [Lentisphaerae bacterium]|nr:acyltransferase [Lentisphaerota bacterium]